MWLMIPFAGNSELHEHLNPVWRFWIYIYAHYIDHEKVVNKHTDAVIYFSGRHQPHHKKLSTDHRGIVMQTFPEKHIAVSETSAEFSQCKANNRC